MPSTVPSVPAEDINILREKHLADTFHNRTALTTSLDAEIISKLKGYGEGFAIRVVWFNQMDSSANVQTTVSDISFITNDINVSYRKINNFEMRLKSGFTFNYNDADNFSTLDGAALLYPGFIPRVGDVFLYELEPGKLGLFKVTGAAKRLTIFTGTSHEVPFTLLGILTADMLTRLISRVRMEAWFEKNRFLTEPGALLLHDDVVDLDYVRRKHAELTKYYVSEFFRKYDYGTFVRKDDVYDPYIVDFLRYTLPSETSGIYAEQLLPEAIGTKNSFWAKLQNPKSLDWRSVYMNYMGMLYEPDLSSYRITTMINRPYVVMTKEAVGTIIDSTTVNKYFGENVNGINVTAFSDMDTLLSFWMTYQVTDVDLVFSECDACYDKTDEEKFYHIPVLLFFLKMLENSILTGKSIKINGPAGSPFRSIPFKQTDPELVAGVLTIISPDSKVVGVMNQLGVPQDVLRAAITYTATGFAIDLNPLMTVLSITEIPGTWNVVISNPAIVSV